MAELYIPSQDGSVVGWVPISGATLVETLDDGATPNDADYVESPSPPNGAVFEVLVPGVADPASNSTAGISVRFRAMGVYEQPTQPGEASGHSWRDFGESLWNYFGPSESGVKPIQATGLLEQYRNLAPDDYYRALVTNPTSGVAVADSGAVLIPASPIIYDVYRNTALLDSDVVWTSGWEIEPVITDKTQKTFVLTGVLAGNLTAYGIGQKPGTPAPTYAQIALGLDGNGATAPMTGQIAGSLGETVELTLTRNTGLSPIFDLYVAVDPAAGVTTFTAQLLSPPPGKGFLVVGGLPAPEGSMLLQLPITVVDGDVIEYDLNSRPSASVVTIQPNGVRSVG